MEVCGTHTVSIGRYGFRSIMPAGLKLLSGPGCPVCVTANCDIDHAIALANIDGAIITTFGDMMRVPGSSTSLAAQKAAGATSASSIPRSTRSTSPSKARSSGHFYGRGL